MADSAAVASGSSVFSTEFLKSCLASTRKEQDDRAQMLAKGIFVCVAAASTKFFADRFEVISFSNPVRWVGSWVQALPFAASLVLTVYFSYTFFEHIDPTGLTPLLKDKFTEYTTPYLKKLVVYSRDLAGKSPEETGQ
ncbi:MAG: hypothetical protein ChlgKO_03420 [Chlamydiales bacterium]